MLYAPEGSKVGRIYVINSLDGLLDDGVAGNNDVAPAVLTDLRVGKDMEFPWLGIHEFPPEFGVQFASPGICHIS